MDAAERLALTEFCAELAALRSESRELSESSQALLARLEAEARARRPILALLKELLGGPPKPTPRITRMPGASGGQADEERFGCPDNACDRVCGTQPAGPIPRCLLTGEPMRRLGG